MPAVRATVRRRPDGFLPVEVIRNSTVVRSAIAASSVPAAWFAMLIALPAVLLSAGWEAWEVGLAMVPSAVVALVVPQVTGPTLNRIGPARALAVSAVVASAALLVATAGAHWTSAPILVVAIILVTFAFGLGQPALSAVVGDAVHQEVRGVALGVSTLLFLIGGSVGSAVVAGISGPLGMPAALLVLAVLPLLGLLVLRPTLRADRSAPEPAQDVTIHEIITPRKFTIGLITASARPSSPKARAAPARRVRPLVSPASAAAPAPSSAGIPHQKNASAGTAATPSTIAPTRRWRSERRNRTDSTETTRPKVPKPITPASCSPRDRGCSPLPV